MHIKHIHEIIEKLASCAHEEFEKGLENVDTEEMCKVADILKDLAEAEYYSKISKAMDESEYSEDYDWHGPLDEKRYYRGRPRDRMGRFKKRGYDEPPYYHMTPEMYKEHGPEYWRDMDRHEGRMYYTEPTHHDGVHMRDHREGRSGHSRRTYMETKEARPGDSPDDKMAKTKELEKYMNELSNDITEMIAGASNEEKTMLKTKMQTLLQKI